MGIPDGWRDYSKCGKILDDLFVCFKTPLHRNVLRMNPDLDRWAVSDLLRKHRNIGLIIDLTFSTKYYNKADVTTRGIGYEKIFVPGHHIPGDKIINQFCNIVNDFVDNKSNDGKIIGVHCTHGVNRTGYLVCQYLIRHREYSPELAIEEFQRARGHDIHRENYTDDLHRNYHY